MNTKKLSKRATALLALTSYTPAANPAIASLVAFATLNPGLERGNYDTCRSFENEKRAISHDLARFRAALIEASSLGVTDAEVIAEAPHAFSGRLEWVSLVKRWMLV